MHFSIPDTQEFINDTGSAYTVSIPFIVFKGVLIHMVIDIFPCSFCSRYNCIRMRKPKSS